MGGSVNYAFSCKTGRLGKILHDNPGNLAGASFICSYSTNVYSTLERAKAATNNNTRNNQSDSTRMFTMFDQTASKISEISKSNNQIYLKIDCGDVNGWVYFCNYILTSSNLDYELSNLTGTIAYANRENAIKAFGHANYLTNGKYASPLVSGNGSLNKDRIKGDTINLDGASDSDTASEYAANSSFLSSASNSNGGGADDIDVTYEFAVKSAGAFIYNIASHLNRNYFVNSDGVVTEKLSGGPGLDFEYYISNINANGVNYRNLRNIFGAPYQFLPTTDCRLSGSGFSDSLAQAGYEFVEKILSRMPLLYITPGNTSFMAGTTENYRTALISQTDSSRIPNSEKENSLEAMLSDYTGKLYTLMPAYPEYFDYVNPMCRAGAIFLRLDEEKRQIDGIPLSEFHWGINEGQAYEIYEEEESTILDDVEDEEETEEESTEGEEDEDEEEEEPTKEKFDWETEQADLFKKSNGFADFQSMLYFGNAIPFYINSEASFQDSFSNETTESSLSSTINSLSDRAREIQFLLGTASSAVGEAFDKVDGTLTDIKEQINSIVEKVAGGNSIFTTIANSVKTIVSGGRMLFPQIWSNSTFSKSYNITIKLTTPSYDRFSWWLNIYVPLCHLMGLVLPRAEYVNSYTTPFIIKAFYRGMFNIDMGIITEMTFNRGKEGSWTKDALPTVVDVSFTIQDLYTGMGMTSTGPMFKGFTLQNVAEMDYIANLCGVNINEPDIFRMVRLWATFNITNRISDFLPNLELNIGSSLRNMAMDVYNSLWGL